MAKKQIQIFKGGRHNGEENRLVINQRPADGHIKAAAWEDYIRVNKHRFDSAELKGLEVGDTLAIHTLLTFGIVEGMGIAIITPEEGLKFKLVSNEASQLDLDNYKVKTFQRQPSGEYTETAEDTVANTEIVASAETYYLILPPADAYSVNINPAYIGLEVTALPSEGLVGVFDLESRLQSRQPVRPPACLECC